MRTVFIGGPLDGTTKDIEDYGDKYYVPVYEPIQVTSSPWDVPATIKFTYFQYSVASFRIPAPDRLFAFAYPSDWSYGQLMEALWWARFNSKEEKGETR